MEKKRMFGPYKQWLSVNYCFCKLLLNIGHTVDSERKKELP